MKKIDLKNLDVKKGLGFAFLLVSAIGAFTDVFERDRLTRKVEELEKKIETKETE